ncbi:ribonuclease domain-containing protein [Streptomyces sp. NPDC058734]|uniref:ribonuclease domain-containing protein n=1 Tax=Streptomyces sp. NPDC058734 TaxID=3346615 RepID=UPI00369C432B
MEQGIVWRTMASVACTAVAVCGTLTPASALTPAQMPLTELVQSASGPGTSTRAVVPEQAWRTLSLIDAGQWPPNDGSGTRGGSAWANPERALPATDAAGNPVRYLEWDVNRKQPDQVRDPERIVTGDDGTAWYSPDLLRTFEQMR